MFNLYKKKNQSIILSLTSENTQLCFVENWTVMINQTHPKILGRLLMGIDAAKRILRRGEPFVLEVSISKPSSKIHGQSSILNTLEKIRLIKLVSFLGTKCEKIL